ncbi:MAG TPA: 1-acyl-sn-glycerol-3-phosphate acyltransferase [Candidatus Avilachnospira avistercoris]|nr:1-acyl-sn-glycerol-3-phosphate acyltransferase [Candidatus Avilachnospira avistercoris]
MIRITLDLIFLFLFLVLGMPVLFFLHLWYKDDWMGDLKSCTRKVRWALNIVVKMSGTTIICEGLENVPKDEAVLFVGNHRSYFDIICTHASLDRPAGFVAKAEMSKVPFLRTWMLRIGCLFLDRKDPREGLKTILKAIEHIKKGASVIIYPEGTRNINEDPKELLPFHEGSLKIAQKAGCLIVPMAIYGTDDILEKHFPVVKKQTITLRFGKPFYSKDIPEGHKKKQGAYVRDIITSMIADIEKERVSL